MNELLPCPFCGEANAYPTEGLCGWSVICDTEGCGASGPDIRIATAADAIKAWNRRADEKFNAAEYPAKGHPWADFLHHRARVLAMWRDEGDSPAQSSWRMNMDPAQAQLILMTYDQGKVF